MRVCIRIYYTYICIRKTVSKIYIELDLNFFNAIQSYRF